MSFIKRVSRDQVLLLPDCLDDYVDENNKVRFIDEFVNGLDLRECGFIYPKERIDGRGRPAYDPADLLKLFIYGYSYGIRSGRKLERSCKVNLEVIWLMGKLKPDFKTICDFRLSNRKAFKKVSAQFTLLCSKLKLISGDFIAVDGTSIKAVNNISKSWTKNKLNSALNKYEQEAEKYLKDLEELDKYPSPKKEDKQQKLKNSLVINQKLSQELTKIKNQLEATGKESISFNDPESRPIKKGRKSTVGYNVQHAVDDKNYLIVAAEVTSQVNDLGSLYSTLKATSDVIEEGKGSNVLADKGYFSNEDIKACEDNGYTCYVPEQGDPMEGRGLYGKDDFIYDKHNDSYICPAGKSLAKFQNKKRGSKQFWIYKTPEACINCSLKAKCTTSKSRSIQRWEHEYVLENVRKRMKAKPGVMKRRAAIVEHPFGTIKEHILTGGYNLTGKESVQAETSLAQLVYNLNRVLNIMKFSELMSLLKDIQGVFLKYIHNHLIISPYLSMKVMKLLLRRNSYTNSLIILV